MPKGTRVHRCVDKLKKEGSSGNAYAICQASTHQNYHTGESLKGLKGKALTKELRKKYGRKSNG